MRTRGSLLGLIGGASTFSGLPRLLRSGLRRGHFRCRYWGRGRRVGTLLLFRFGLCLRIGLCLLRHSPLCFLSLLTLFLGLFLALRLFGGRSFSCCLRFFFLLRGDSRLPFFFLLATELRFSFLLGLLPFINTGESYAKIARVEG